MRSLRRPLTLGMLAAFTLLLGAGGGLVYWAVRDTLYDQFDAGLRVRALMVSTETQVAGGRIRVYFSDRFLREFDDALATEFFQVFDAEGRPIERSDSLPGEVNLPIRYGTVTQPEYWNLDLPNGQAGRAVGLRFKPAPARRSDRSVDPDAVPEAIVVVAASRRELIDTVTTLRHVLLASGLGLLAVTAVVVPWALRRGLRPLDQVGATVSRIDAHSLEQRFAVTTWPRELAPVGERLNDLLLRLQRSFERERTFSADMAHELRTPLAELRSLAEVALKWPEERTPEMDRAVLEATVQMERLVERLLVLGRAEQGRLKLEPEPIDVGGLVDQVVTSLAERMTHRGLRLVRRIQPGISWATDRVLLTSIVRNLVENAVDYAPPESVLIVAVEANAANCRLAVHNPAPELEPADIPRLFERFWRKDNARSSGEHSGLGLALSRSFAQVLGGSLEAELQERELVVILLLRSGLPETVRAR